MQIIKFDSGITQPEDKGILLKDILETNPGELYKSTTPYNHKGGNQLNNSYKSQANTIHDENKKSMTLCAGTHGYAMGHVRCGAMRGRYVLDGKRQDGKMKTAGLTTQRLELRKDEKTNTITTVQKDNYVVYRPCKPRKMKASSICHHVADATDIKGHDILRRVYSDEGKSPTITASSGGNMKPKVKIRNKSKCVRSSGRNSYDRHEWDSISDSHYRKLTPRECFRLQTIPELHIETLLNSGISNTQLYKMAGNGWTVDVVAHILKGLN